MKRNWDNSFIDIAFIISKHSHAKRKKVGAILVKDNRIISIGYNGTPTGFKNKCEIKNKTKINVLHAESNCITKCAKSNENSNGAILYVTVSPCIECAKLIIQSGIVAVYFKEKYRKKSGLKLLKKAKINCNEI